MEIKFGRDCLDSSGSLIVVSLIVVSLIAFYFYI